MKFFDRDEDALKAEREKDKNAENGNGQSMFYSLKNGRTVLRILPCWSNEGVWFREMREYYFKLGEDHLFLTSPLDFGQRDPLDEWSKAVYEKGNDEATKEARRFRAKYRYLVNALVLSDNQGTTMSDGVKVVKLPKVVKMSLVDFDTDPEYGDITNPEKGFNMIIDREGEGLDTKYTVKAQRERSNIFATLKEMGTNPDQVELYDLDVIHRTGIKSEEELEGLLEQLKGNITPSQQSTASFRTTTQFSHPQASDGGPQPVPTGSAMGPTMTAPSGSPITPPLNGGE